MTARYCLPLSTGEHSMGIHEELVAELKDAMKSRDKARTNVIRQIQRRRGRRFVQGNHRLLRQEDGKGSQRV